MARCSAALSATLPRRGRRAAAAAYNRVMLHTLQPLLAPPVMERVTLLLNHVLAAEPVAQQRLLPHAGKALRLELRSWPALLPPPPSLLWRITPAGLLEWQGADGAAAAELGLQVDAANPALLAARLMAGERAQVEVAGDAALAGDIDWLLQNLRWDLAGDLERVFPAPLAAGLVRAGSLLAQGLRAAVQGLTSLRGLAPGRPSP